MKSSERGDSIQDQLTFRLSRLNARLNAQASRLLGENHGISLTQWRVLVLVRSLDRPTLTEIARESQLDKGQLSRCIRGMLASGLVMASESETDHRKSRLCLTVKGERLHKYAWPAMRSRREMLMDTMSGAERRIVFDVLDRLESVAQVELGP
ncbi:MAG: MarR family transcriptional regulator [Rhodobacter sp.]|nr:MarR family transcriptional regulator [Rhodobacter sp.]MCY4167621.1 MarR family transcriptional regulator [Rhodobacter sp.]MCY4243601.1 MarR family transcriptional regulator [Rhodobacter sp.]